MNCSENCFSRSNLCISKPTPSPPTCLLLPRFQPIFFFYKYSHYLAGRPLEKRKRLPRRSCLLSGASDSCWGPWTPPCLCSVALARHCLTLRPGLSQQLFPNLLHPLSQWNVPECQAPPAQQPSSRQETKSGSRAWKASSSASLHEATLPPQAHPYFPFLFCHACLLSQKVLCVFFKPLYFHIGQSFSHCLNPFLVWLNLKLRLSSNVTSFQSSAWHTAPSPSPCTVGCVPALLHLLVYTGPSPLNWEVYLS